MNNTDVLIVGAGPSGLTLATSLVKRGITTSVVDRQAAGANTSRAATRIALRVASERLDCGECVSSSMPTSVGQQLLTPVEWTGSFVNKRWQTVVGKRSLTNSCGPAGVGIRRPP
jgi:predicted NAD/FAD-dependent oxidoreductase